MTFGPIASLRHRARSIHDSSERSRASMRAVLERPTNDGGAASSWYALTSSEVAANVGSDHELGLDQTEAERRLLVDGPNELIGEKARSPWLMLLAQFTNTIIVVLMLAGVVTVVVGDTKDALIIATVITLNAVISFFQDYRAEQAIAALKRLSEPQARVTRGGQTRTVSAEHLVVGDVIELEPGDVVPADARLIQAPSLRVDESTLTGESVPVDKAPDVIAGDEVPLADQRNMLFKGTEVTYGRGRAMVVATGTRTQLGQIAQLLRAHRAPPTPLQRRLALLGRQLALGVVAISAVVFAIGVASGESLTRMLLVAVSLAVAAIPESLPAVVTLSLALGAHRMVVRRAIVRKLPAVEALGSVTVIATDKTGTLTQGRMAVERLWVGGQDFEVTGSGYVPEGEIRSEVSGESLIDDSRHSMLQRLLTAGALANDAALIAPGDDNDEWGVAGDPTDGALLVVAAKGGVTRDELSSSLPRVAEVSFDSRRKRVTTVHGATSNELVVATKGAVESVLSCATMLLVGDGSDRAITDDDRDVITARAERYAADGYRVLAVAGRAIDALPPRIADVEQSLVFYGLVAMMDPPRPEAADSVRAAHRAGIQVVMITGDHPSTAQVVAERLGILDGRRVVRGDELFKMADNELAEAVPDIAVFARTTAEQKLDIVRAWAARHEVIAMTGDGVNDAPALRRADIGVAMGRSGTDVSKEAADIVLADDNFASIVAAVGEGRRVYDNIRRFVRYGLIGGVAEIWVMLLGPFVGLSLALLPGQILWINLLTHGLPGLALGVEAAEDDTMSRPPRRPAESIFARGLGRDVAVMGIWTAAVSLGLGIWGNETGRPWQTMIFTSLALLQLGNAIALRSEKRSVLALGWRTNRPLALTLLATLALQLVAVYWQPLQNTLELDPLGLRDLIVVLAASSLGLLAIEAQKFLARRRAVSLLVP